MTPGVKKIAEVLLFGAIVLSGCGREDSGPGEQPPSEAENQADVADSVLAPGRAGAVRIGMSRKEVYDIYGEGNIRETDLRIEGTPSPALEIRIPGSPSADPSLIAELTENRASVWRIRVYDPCFRTEKDIGPGSTLGELHEMYAVDGVFFGEGNTVARVEELGISFVLDPATLPEEYFRANDPRLIPQTAQIDWALVTGG